LLSYVASNFNLRRYTPVPVFPPEVEQVKGVEQAEAAEVAEEVNEAEQAEAAQTANTTEKATQAEAAEASWAAPCLDLEDVWEMSVDVMEKSGDVVGRCKWTVSNPVLKAPVVSGLETIIR
jgi:hypothetical protein